MNLLGIIACSIIILVCVALYAAFKEKENHPKKHIYKKQDDWGEFPW